MNICPLKWALSIEITVLLSKSKTQEVNTENKAGRGAFLVNTVDKDDEGNTDTAHHC